MKANQLRIGNFIKINGEVVFGIGYGVIMDVAQIEKGIKNDYLNLLKHEPIPLTEDYLLRFKFQFYLDGFKKHGLVLYKNGYVIECFYRDPNVERMVKLINIKAVHQLQNLYFALFGEELSQEIKFSKNYN